MSPRTRDGIAGARRMVALLWQDNPAVAFDYVTGLDRAVDPDSAAFHPQRLALEAAEDALVALWAAHLDTAEVPR